MTHPKHIRPVTVTAFTRQHPVLIFAIALYIVAGSWFSFGDFHHVHLGSIADVDYQAQFEADAFMFKILCIAFILIPVWCLYMEFYVEDMLPTLNIYIKRYLLCIIPALLTSVLVFYWRQDPDVVSGEGHSGTVSSLTFWLSTLLFWAMTRTLSHR
ncbi:hypothetical protein F8O53_04240 [Enterobacter sp. 63]